MLTNDQLDEMLHLWGRAYGEPRPAEWDELDAASVGSSPLARAMQHAPGSRREVVQLQVHRRRTSARRGLMAAAAGVPGMGAVPTWACDPVPATETRQALGMPPVARPSQEIVVQVQSAWRALLKISTLRAQVLRVEYQVRAKRQAEKALDVAQLLKTPVSLAVYRNELQAARIWMHGRLS